MVEEKQDIANATHLYAVIVSNPIFKKLHAELLITTGKYFRKNRKKNTLLILGVSPIASPYGDNKKWVEAYFGKDGKIIAVDYNLKVIRECFKYLCNNGFFQVLKPKIFLRSKKSYNEFLTDDFKNYLNEKKVPIKSLIRIYHAKINKDQFENCSFNMIESDLNFPLPIPSNSVSVIDSTLTLHHLAAYKLQFEKILSEIYRVLEYKGLFHLGDAFFDMRYIEEKICKIMFHLCNILNKDVLFKDQRNSVDFKAIFKKGRKYNFVPISEKIKNKGLKTIVLDSFGFVAIPYSKEIKNNLMKKGFKNITCAKNKIKMPLIDKEIKDDQKFIEAVNRYYELNRKLKESLKNFPRNLIYKSIKRGNKERENALKGLFEYYFPHYFATNSLKRAGFKNIKCLFTKKMKGLRVGAVLVCKKS